MKTIDESNLVTLLGYFYCTLDGKYLPSTGKNYMDVALVINHINEYALQCGYIVLPGAYNTVTEQFLKTEQFDTTSTFYKTWESVTSKNRLELFLDQVTHYAVAYLAGETWTPEPNGPKFDVHFENYKIISAVTPKELMNKCLDVLKSGVALKSEIVSAMVGYLVDYKNVYDTDWEFPFDKILNKEAPIIYCDKTETYPTRGEDIVRYICYKATGVPMTIINKSTLMSVSDWSRYESMADIFNEDQMVEMARVFLRFKPIFLAMKTNVVNNKLVNKLRKMADKYHKPMVQDYWGNILNTVKDYAEISKKAKSLNNYRLIQLYQAALERMDLALKGGPEFYRVRNGKVFIKKGVKVAEGHVEYLNNLCVIFRKQLVSNLKSKACVIKFPKDLNLACPTSAKNFVGNMPFGSYHCLGRKNSIFGIYWKNEWGTHDFDLSFMDFDGHKIAWNSDFYNNDNSVVFSGDMVNADPDAAELIYCKSGCPNGLIYCNRFNGREGSKFRFFTAIDNEGQKYIHRQWSSRSNTPMVDPGKVKVSEMMVSTKREEQVGLILDNRIYFMQLDLTNSRVSGGVSVSDLENIYKRKAKNTMYVKDILLEAGFVDYDVINKDVKKEDIVPYEIDLTVDDKSVLINLFAK